MNVYDFDETIYDGESSIEFILQYIRVDPSIVRFLPAIFKVLRRYNRGEVTFESFTQEYSPVFREYFAKKSPALEGLVDDFWDKREHKIKPFYRRLQRSDDVIITASPYFMMEEICKRIGVKHLIATDFDLKTGEIHSACFRENKIALFRERFGSAQIDDFYTDSVNDACFFPLARRAFMVEGHQIRQVK